MRGLRKFVRARKRAPSAEQTVRRRAGQAISIGRAIAGMVTLGVVYGLSKAIMNPLDSTLDDQVTNSTAQQGLDWTMQIYSNFLFVFIAVAALGTIALAVYQRQGGLR